MLPDANIRQPLIDVANAVLKFFHDTVGLSWGLSIVAITVCTRAILVPLTYKQIKGMRAMQALQQDMMRFYKENKVTPFASCVPLLAQLPVFITPFYTLRHELPKDICSGLGLPEGCETAGHASFLFVEDLTAKAHGAELIALLVLYVGTQLISGFFMSVTADKSQRTMMFILPLVFVPFVISFPSGLIVYWITTNLWTIGQGITVNKLIPAPKVATIKEKQAAKPPPKSPKKKKRRR